MLREDALNIFTDGCSLQSPRRGGIGVRYILVSESGEEELQDVQFVGYAGATNNQMELQACIVALEEALRLHLTSGVGKVVVFTDSQYVADNIVRAKFEWPRAKWHSRRGRPVLNADLWKRLIRLLHKVGKRVEFKWIKGHAKSSHNKAADRMARQSSLVPTNEALSVVHVRRKQSQRSVDVGCVDMNGQRLSVRVITAEYLPVQHVWKYKYEVVSKKSKFYGLIDIVFSEELLEPGHAYFVQVNKEPGNPRIVRVFREIQ